MTSERIGVFGGTFDPPHIGHLVAAVNTAHLLDLDQVYFVVSNISWQKVRTRPLSTAEDRLAMARLAVGTNHRLVASDVELRLGGDSVTANTLDALHTDRPDAEFFVIVGSDAAKGVGTWRRQQDLKRLANLVVIDRPGSEGGRPPDGFRYQVVECPLVDVSSSDIRSRSRRGAPIDFLVPDPVRDYVETHALYS